MERILHGIGVASGIGIGPALVFDVDRYDVPKYEAEDTEAELRRLNTAIDATREELQRLYDKTALELGQTHADIFDVHLKILDDVVLREQITEELNATGKNVEQILDKLMRHYVEIMNRSDDPTFRDRTADLLDVSDRVMRRMLDAERPNLKDLAEPSVVLAHELSPSDIVTMDVRNTVGIVMDAGGVTSHAAILARALEIPTVMGIAHLSSQVKPGTMLVVNGTDGTVILDPDEETLERCRREQVREEQRREKLRQAVQAGPCLTRDQVSIPALANIELPLEIEHGLRNSAEGIGLYRTEYLFLNRNTLPSEEEQYEAYWEAASAMDPQPVTLRTMDIGGDKFVSHLQLSREENPQLGWRAVRFCLARPDIFKVQLRAMLRASTRGNVRIMFPMISGVEELRQVKQILGEARDELQAAGIRYDKNLQVGSMIEVPSAVALAEMLAEECDFFSIGTNDLIQYSLAVDRMNEKIAHLYEPAHPAVLRMIYWTAGNAKRAGIPCGICGEMAGDPLFTELLLGLGVTSFSMSAIAIPSVRAEITKSDTREAREFAEELLKLRTYKEVRGRLKERFQARSGGEED